jgi:CRP-like cAMP-binding protein
MLVQAPGTALRWPVERFQAKGVLRKLLGSYTHALLTLIAQSAACNVLHRLEERLSRWLLMMHDRVPGGRFRVTQEFMAGMLGVNRATLSGIAARLQRAGHIRYRRGTMAVLDGAGLAGAACPCYSAIRGEFERCLGWPPSV